MVALLKNRGGLWPVDKIMLGYGCFTTVLLIGWWRSIPQAWWLMVCHVGCTALLLAAVRYPSPASWVFRNWYPLLYVGAFYKEMAMLIQPIRHSDADAWLAQLDLRIWGAHPTVWLERIQTPALTELLQWVYTLFVPAVLLIGFLLWRRGQTAEFQYFAFLIVAGFLASYLGYLAVPARGPRFLLNSLQHIPLRGLWLFEGMQHTLDRLESAHYDCFPSGHTELTVLAWWSSRMISKPLFHAYSVYTPSIIFATVYLRYHYSVDLLAGAILAMFLIWAAPFAYYRLQERA